MAKRSRLRLAVQRDINPQSIAALLLVVWNAAWGRMAESSHPHYAVCASSMRVERLLQIGLAAMATLGTLLLGYGQQSF